MRAPAKLLSVVTLAALVTARPDRRATPCDGDYCGTLVFAAPGQPDILLPPVSVQGLSRDIYQQTFTHGVTHFGLEGFEGTSESTPHVTAIAALILATGVIGKHPAPDAVQSRIEATATDMGAPGPDSRYGAGLANAAAAITP